MIRIPAFIRKRRARIMRRRWRSILRAHRAILAKDEDLGNYVLLDRFASAPAPVAPDRLRALADAYPTGAVETCLRQHVYFDSWIFMMSELGRHVAEAGAEVILTFPKAWRDYGREIGITVSPKSRRYFAIYLGIRLIAGWKCWWQLLNAQRRGLLVNGPGPDHQVLLMMPSTAVPLPADKPEAAFQRHTFHHWLGKEMRLPSGFPFLAEDRRLSKPVPLHENGVHVPRHIPALRSGRALFGFALSGLRAGAAAAVGLLTGAWWKAVLLEERIEADYFRRVPDQDLAQRYVFHSGNYRVRPLWSYDAEARGAEVILALYSANFIPFSPNRIYDDAKPMGQSLMRWPTIYCIGDVSKRGLMANGHAADTINVATYPIDLKDNERETPTFDCPTLAAFDVPPYRSYFKATRGFHNAYYTFETWQRFIRDLVAVSQDNGLLLLIKTKRDAFRFDDPRYPRMLEDLGDHPSVFCVDPGIAASRLLETADLVVSMPFTSVSKFAEIAGKSTTYYDPGARLRHWSDIAGGIPVAYSREELESWVKERLGSAPARRVV